MAVGRFQVMAVLQAARAYILGLPLDTAKSFGLNRAIFYAAAKKGFISKKAFIPGEKVAPPPVPEEDRKAFEESFGVYHLGDEMAYRVEKDGRMLFVMGSEIQSPEDFERQVERRFGRHFESAWNEACQILEKMDKGVLLSQRYFYEFAYKPRRDELAKKWSALASSE